ncbi:MAG: MarR family transcriptional regulator [Pseudomonadota bacterium]|nr:MarR family transcriptional regulator [Pseudomonadota bacterium]
MLRRFRVVFNAVKSHFRAIERKAEIGGAQLWALSVIASSPGLTVSDLARAMDIRQSTASNLVKGLIQRELVAPVRGEQDRRTTLLTIQPAGRSILRRAPGPFSGVLPDALSRLDPQVLARLDADLGRLIAELEADPKAEQTPLADL